MPRKFNKPFTKRNSDSKENRKPLGDKPKRFKKSDNSSFGNKKRFFKNDEGSGIEKKSFGNNPGRFKKSDQPLLIHQRRRQ